MKLKNIEALIETINGPILMGRCPAEGLYGAFVYRREDAGILAKLLGPPFMFMLGGAVGAIEGLVSITCGLVDTATGGYFELLPDKWTTLSVQLAEECMVTYDTAVEMGREDKCGRRIDVYGHPQPVPQPAPTSTPGLLPPEKLRPIPIDDLSQGQLEWRGPNLPLDRTAGMNRCVWIEPSPSARGRSAAPRSARHFKKGAAFV